MKEIIHFTADWCAPCKKLKPIIEEYIKENPEIIWTIIDVDTEFDIASTYNVMSIPTLIFVDNKEIINRHIGIVTKEQIANLFNK